MGRDFSKPVRQGWPVLVVMLAKSFRGWLRLLWPVLLVLVTRKRGKALWVTLIVCIVASLLVFWLLTFLRYLTLTIHVEGGKLICRHGLIQKNELTIPLHRIHALRTNSGPLYQMVDMVGVVFDTVADKNAEVEVLLSEEDWAALRSLVAPLEEETSTIEKGRRSDHAAEPHEEAVRAEQKPSYSYQMSFRDILRATLAQNPLKGFALMLTGLFYTYQQIYDLGDVTNALYQYAELTIAQASITFITILAVSAYLLSLILFFGYYIFRFWNLRVEIRGDQLTYERGLLTRKSITIYQDKICSIQMKQNILERKLRIYTLQLNQAKNVEGKNAENTVSLLGFPTPQPILEWCGVGESEVLFWAHSQRMLFWRSLLLRWSLPMLATLPLALFVTPYCLLLLIPILTLALWESGNRLCRSSVVLYPEYLTIHSGYFAEVHTWIPLHQVVNLAMRQWHFLQPHTANPKRHLRIQTMSGVHLVRSLQHQSLSSLYDYLLFRISQSQLRRKRER